MSSCILLLILLLTNINKDEQMYCSLLVLLSCY